MSSVLWDRGILLVPLQAQDPMDESGKLVYFSDSEDFRMAISQNPYAKAGPLHSIHLSSGIQSSNPQSIQVDLPDALEWVDRVEVDEELAMEGLLNHIGACKVWLMGTSQSQAQHAQAAQEAYYHFNRRLRSQSQERDNSIVQVRYIPGGRSQPGEFRFEGTGFWPRHFESVRKIKRCVHAPMSKEIYDSTTRIGWENCRSLGLYLYFLFEDVLRSAQDKRSRYINS